MSGNGEDHKMMQLSAELLELSPEIQTVLEGAKEEDSISLEGMYAQIQAILDDDPNLALKVQETLERHMMPIQQAHQERMDALKGDLLFRTNTGRMRLNPLYEAALAERAQFDGDIPEFRTGLLSDDVAPAVPVDTTARDPVMMGRLLQIASNQVRKDVLARQNSLKQEVFAQIGKCESTALEKVSEQALARIEFDKSIDPPEYQRGKQPALLKIAGEIPLGVDALALSPQERQEMAWKFVSTTQGRRSALPIIAAEIAVALEDAGLVVRHSEFSPDDLEVEILAHHVWTLQIQCGGGDTQVNFSPIDIAAAVLKQRLLQQMQQKFADLTGMVVWLEVISSNQINDREVGWAARLLRKGN